MRLRFWCGSWEFLYCAALSGRAIRLRAARGRDHALADGRNRAYPGSATGAHRRSPRSTAVFGSGRSQRLNPLSSIYGGAVRARNALYDWKIVRAQRLQGAIVSIGNISAGGSGKTPFVLLLGGLLQQRGIKFDILSRGYGRTSKGVRLVDPAGLPHEFG